MFGGLDDIAIDARLIPNTGKPVWISAMKKGLFTPPGVHHIKAQINLGGLGSQNRVKSMAPEMEI